ncbi:MAG TPA: Fur family transcriptional regulator [Burkholderiaceae bacterium]|nr:Fur family transcriptional regulator [Burkholderiaceae bacterium]HMZ00697.1 Fur family transcriptional regulator [Burkholderiaceae bacterium]HNB46548.1 Fur family transcriptional regulator [Burkholderiaceae bacterium]HNG81397.1 Fur family transcriptional regulator [Burkholderiaceae bacterium]
MCAWSLTPLQARLHAAGIQPTLQRLTVAAVMFERPVHLTAEQVLTAARERMPEISRATVYSTLQLFVDHGLLRPLVIDGVATVYDSTTTPHHHLFDVDTGEVCDLPDGHVQVLGLPALGKDLEVAEVDVVVRVRRRRQPSAATSA